MAKNFPSATKSRSGYEYQTLRVPALGGREYPDVKARYDADPTLPPKAADRWTAIGADIGLSPSQVCHLWYLSDSAYPDLAIDPDDEVTLVKAVETQKLRWERLGARMGLSVREVKDRYQIAAKKLPETRYSGSGRRFGEMYDGLRPATKGEVEKVETTRAVRKAKIVTGPGSDRKTLQIAKDQIKERNEARKLARQAKKEVKA